MTCICGNQPEIIKKNDNYEYFCPHCGRIEIGQTKEEAELHWNLSCLDAYADQKGGR